MKTPSTSTILVILGALIWSSAGSLAGCLSTQLKAPVMDHSVQLHVIADRCKGKGEVPYSEAPCSAELQADLDALAKQAELIRDIVEEPK